MIISAQVESDLVALEDEEKNEYLIDLGGGPISIGLNFWCRVYIGWISKHSLQPGQNTGVDVKKVAPRKKQHQLSTVISKKDLLELSVTGKSYVIVRWANA